MDAQRAPNFNNPEVELLVNIISGYKNIVESKKTDSTTWQEKSNAWNIICEKFNASSPANIHRNVKSIKAKYEMLKKGIRKKLIIIKGDKVKPGGEPSSSNIHLNKYEKRILQLMDPTAKIGLKGKFGEDNDENADEDSEEIDKTCDVEFFEIAKIEGNEQPFLFDRVEDPFSEPGPSISKVASISGGGFSFKNKKKRKFLDIKSAKLEILKQQKEFYFNENKRREELHQLTVASLKLDIELKKKKLNEM